MPSETDLLNDALSQIGQAPITGIDEGTVTANHCLRLYPALRQAILRAGRWNFAEARVELVQDATAPVFGYAYAYLLPTDLLAIREYYGGSPTATVSAWPPYLLPPRGQYTIEGRRLMTNDGQVFIVYTRDMDNPGQWDPLFYQVVATWLASKLCLAIAKDERRAGELLKHATGLLMPFAAAVDGQEGSITPYIVDTLIWGR